ncbi:MAG: 3-keto-5-aminohexanoate cleavage protein [Novosphingobium sp.]|nr:3-keto-5-aminohexanoate cleavage protein [Novosphingobium sp.]
MKPVIIEVALNGACKKVRNPNVPVSPDEIVADALRCMEAGAQSVHNHIEDQRLTGAAAADRYLEAWRPIHAANPDVLLCPTITIGETIEERQSHVEELAKSGLMKFGPLDPGSVNLTGSGGLQNGIPTGSIVYSHGYPDCAFILEQLERHRLAANISIFDASFLRAALAFQEAGRLRHGNLVKLYFGGDYSIADGTPNPLTFGFRPTRKALEAYLEMLEGSGLCWIVNVYGGDVVKSGLARMALELGGHVRVGLEDYAGDRTPSNLELVEEVVELAQQVGRPIASCREAAEMMSITAAAPA